MGNHNLHAESGKLNEEIAVFNVLLPLFQNIT